MYIEGTYLGQSYILQKTEKKVFKQSIVHYIVLYINPFIYQIHACNKYFADILIIDESLYVIKRKIDNERTKIK